ncbi:MFS transporter [Lactobacillus buchneri]|nr:MFS transporter [Lentilactobacillus buchneri]
MILMEKTKGISRQLITAGWTSFFSEIGSSTFMFSVSLLLLHTYHNAGVFTLVQLLEPGIILLFNPFIGVYVDQHKKKNIALTSQLGLVITFVILSAWINKAIKSPLFLVYLTICLFIILISTQSRKVSYQAAVISMMPRGSVNKMVSVQQTCTLSATLIAPFIGSLLYSTLCFKSSVFFEGVTEIIVLLGIFLIKFELYATGNHTFQGTQKNILSQLASGLTIIKVHRNLLLVVLLSSFINFFFAAINIGLPITVIESKNMGSFSLAVIEVGLSIGMLSGGITSGFMKSVNITVIGFRLAIIGILVVAMGVFFLSNVLIIILIGITTLCFFVGLLIVRINIPMSSYVKESVPLDYQGRVNSTVDALSSLMSPFGIITFGFLFAHTWNPTIYLLSGLFILFISIGFSHKISKGD